MDKAELLKAEARKFSYISNEFRYAAQNSMREGKAQYEEVFSDLADNYQKLADLLYAEAANG